MTAPSTTRVSRSSGSSRTAAACSTSLRCAPHEQPRRRRGRRGSKGSPKADMASPGFAAPEWQRVCQPASTLPPNSVPRTGALAKVNSKRNGQRLGSLAAPALRTAQVKKLGGSAARLCLPFAGSGVVCCSAATDWRRLPYALLGRFLPRLGPSFGAALFRTAVLSVVEGLALIFEAASVRRTGP